MEDTNQQEILVSSEEDQTTETSNPEKEKAVSQGWRDKEEYVTSGGILEKWVDFGEFNRRGELIEAIHKSNQKYKQVEEQLNVLTKHHEKVAQSSYEKARRDLLEEKRIAAKENNLEKLVEVDEQLQSLQPPEKLPTKVEVPQELEEFVTRNTWYNSDEDLRAYANGIGAYIEKNNPNLPVKEILKRVEDKVKQTFPNKFKVSNTNSSVSSVISSRNNSVVGGSPKKNRITYNDLPQEAKQIFDIVVKSNKNPNGRLSPEGYLKDYAQITGMPYEE